MPVFPYKISGDSEPNDYINASFVSDVFSGAPQKYIAAQVRIIHEEHHHVFQLYFYSNNSGHVFKYIFHNPYIFEKYLPLSVMKIFGLNLGSGSGHNPSLLVNDLAVQRACGGDAD